MPEIRALIVDDEELARRRLRNLLREHDDVVVIGECANGEEAIAAIERERPDLLFLDVQMPGADGFEVVDLVGPDAVPYIVFVTAYDQYAVRAFEVHALDYLLKPVDRERFEAMLYRVRATLEKEGASTMAEPLSEMLEARRRDSRTLDRIVVKRGDRILLVSVDDIDWIESAGNYVRLHVGKDSHLIRETMNAIEGKLPEGFIRIHRTTIVRLDRIKELERIAHGDYHVILKDGTIVLLSRHFRDKLEAVLGRF